MYLRVMKRLSRVILLITLPFYLDGQVNTFKSGEDKQFEKFFFNERIQSILPDTIHKLHIFPRLFGVGNLDKNKIYNSYLFGVGLSSSINNKLIITASYDNLKGDHNALVSEYIDSLLVYPGFGLNNQRFQFNSRYSINKFFTIDIGKEKHFIGNGYRSLLLSSEHSPYPYLRLTTKFWRVRYYNLYTTFLDIQDIYQRKKHSSIHLLDFRIANKLNVSIFEAVVWNSANELFHRGYDVAYLNPIIFYRPVEFSKHSPDNVLMGININLNIKRNILYGQILLDDLNISRARDGDDDHYISESSNGFFQNKFAFQLGYKTKIMNKLNLLLEYNQAQPYTYAHKEPMQTYTHLNQALAHPLGANFKEMVSIVEYEHKKIHFTIKYTLARVGLDSIETHYGQNIFVSDYYAQADANLYSYGNFNGQGVLTAISTLQTEVVYSLKDIDLFATINYKEKKSDFINQTFLYYSLGLRTFPFSSFTDY